ncbi:uncharacterized protein [Prorops nasuta]|uniref:uncharacterized protein n=1 Tax=Prorops nasuta TaxID=863751 RepID=UPI0034CEC17E
MSEITESESSSDEEAEEEEEEEEDVGEDSESFVTTEHEDSESPDGETTERLKGGTDAPKVGKFQMKKCLREEWKCDENLWRTYMRLYAEKNEELDAKDRFKERKAADLTHYASKEEVGGPPYACFPMSGFQLEPRNELPDNLQPEKKIRIWRRMRRDPRVDMSSRRKDGDSETETDTEEEAEEWPKRWPCTTRDLRAEVRAREKAKKRKRRDLFPCDSEESSGDPELEEEKLEFAIAKELGHARIPPICPNPEVILIDRAVGDQQGLVDGDYVSFAMLSMRNLRVHSAVLIRGSKGMRLHDLCCFRERRNTWKFCFYQALVALLAKTQIRYKYAWAANIDYIYDHAWMLFTHVGMINVKTKNHERQKLNDLVVYNYKYDVDVELAQELKDIPFFENASFDYEEPYIRKKYVSERPELMKTKRLLGYQNRTDEHEILIHEETEEIEGWFDELPARFRNCIFKTTRFSLAFWRDGQFWYLYNPYRCDEFGFWDDNGYACIMKLCSKQALKRHLMILLIRAYAYQLPMPEEILPEVVVTIDDTKLNAAEGLTPTTDVNELTGEERYGEGYPGKLELPKDYLEDSGEQQFEVVGERIEDTVERPRLFDIQIFNVIYNCCKLHNLKLLEKRGPMKPKELVKRKTIEECPFDPLDSRDPCTVEMDEGDEPVDIEKPTWLKLHSVTWSRSDKKPQKTKKDNTPKMRWHQFTVEESNKLFSLWGELHITDMMFDRENRAMQTYACYVVCAGMTRIMAPEYWSSKILDVIVMCGDRYYSHSKLEAKYKATLPEYSHVKSWNKYLMNHFSIGETMFEARVLPPICGRLYAASTKNLWRSVQQMFLKYKFAILTCEASCLGIFKFCGAYYMCDVNSFGPPLFPHGGGAAYLLRATSFNRFIIILVLTVASPECTSFALNPIEILKVIDLGKKMEFPGRRRNDRQGSRKKPAELCPFDEQKKKHLRNWKNRRQENLRKSLDRTVCKDSD